MLPRHFKIVKDLGRYLQQAIWDFTAVEQAPLHVDRDLRLLLSVPETADEVPVTVTMCGQVTAAGLAGAIPLLGRRSRTFVVYQQLR